MAALLIVNFDPTMGDLAGSHHRLKAVKQKEGKGRRARGARGGREGGYS